MTPNEVLAHYGRKKLIADALKITAPSVNAWFINGEIPELRQMQLEKLTNGQLKAVQTNRIQSKLRNAITVMLTDEQLKTAALAGRGNISEGVRSAINSFENRHVEVINDTVNT